MAAAELLQQGCEVTIFEKGGSVGGLYSKVATPFGSLELGMHVLYAAAPHYRHLLDIFGSDSFFVLRGPRVDMGASANFGRVYWGSPYPSLLSNEMRTRVLGEMVSSPPAGEAGANAEVEAVRRFGVTGGQEVVLPIVRKLWRRDPAELSQHALHCFFDLRRIVVANKFEADRLKDVPALDDVLANPDQVNPKGQVFGGRVGLVFREGIDDLSERAERWARRVGITLRFGTDVSAAQGVLRVDTADSLHDFDACLVAIPAHLLAQEVADEADKVELSVYYLRLETPIGNSFPSYYILAHDPGFRSSRIVNYSGYRPAGEKEDGAVIAVEAIHTPGAVPSVGEISEEVLRLLPEASLSGTYRLPRSMPVLVPSLANGGLLDHLEASIAIAFGKPLFFSGMRTDTGIFFSHHTIGLAYECALECIRRLR